MLLHPCFSPHSLEGSKLGFCLRAYTQTCLSPSSTARRLYFFFHKLELNMPIVFLLLCIYTKMQH